MQYDLLSVDLSENLISGDIITLKISFFGRDRPSAAFIVRSPHKWEAKR